MPVFNNTVYGPGFVGSDDGAPSAGFGIDDVSTSASHGDRPVTKAGDTIQATASSGRDRVHDQDAVRDPVRFAGMIQFTNSTPIPRFATSSRTRRSLRASASASTPTTPPTDYTPPVCFVTGTRIRVMRDGLAAEGRGRGPAGRRPRGDRLRRRPADHLDRASGHRRRRTTLAPRPAADPCPRRRLRGGPPGPDLCLSRPPGPRRCRCGQRGRPPRAGDVA